MTHVIDHVMLCYITCFSINVHVLYTKSLLLCQFSCAQTVDQRPGTITFVLILNFMAHSILALINI